MAWFLLFPVGILGLIHLYLWKRLARDTTRRGRWRRAGGFAMFAAALLPPAALLSSAVSPRYEVWLAWPGYLWLAVMFYLFVILVMFEVPVLAAGLVWRWRARRAETAPDLVLVGAGGPADPSGADPSGADPSGADPPAARDAGTAPTVDRRLLLRRGAAMAAGLTAAGVTGYGVRRAFDAPTVKRLAVPLARLDRRADGLRVAVIADIHVGPLLGTAHTERVVHIVNSLDADIVTVVGDLVSSEVGEVRRAAEPLARMRSRYGSFFVTGNHEYYTGAEEWIDAAEELGLRVLRNERVEIAHRGGAIDLAGVNDPTGVQYGDAPDYAAALGDRDGSRPVVLMAHQPVQVHEAARYGVDLQLSGHTHGGQLWPFDYLVRLQQPVVSGLAEVDGTQVYVTNGAGFWGPPVRVGADPDITLIELRAA